jgi:hypothetical protein
VVTEDSAPWWGSASAFSRTFNRANGTILQYDPGGTKKESTASLPAVNVNDFATRWQTAAQEICAIPPS